MQAPTRRSLMHLGLSGLQAQAHGKRVHAPTATDRSLTARSSAPVSALPPARVQLSRNAPWVPRVQLQPGASAIRFERRWDYPQSLRLTRHTQSSKSPTPPTSALPLNHMWEQPISARSQPWMDSCLYNQAPTRSRRSESPPPLVKSLLYTPTLYPHLEPELSPLIPSPLPCWPHERLGSRTKHTAKAQPIHVRCQHV